LVPAFDSLQQSYDVDVSVVESEITVTPVALDSSTTISVNGIAVSSGETSAPIVLDVGSNDVVVAVTGSNGESVDYTLTVARGAEVIEQIAYGKASNTGASDFFGGSIALAGDTLVVGAAGEASSAIGVSNNQADDTADDSGAVYVFRRTGTTWAQEAYIKASNTEEGDGFGGSVSLFGDTLAVGAPGEASSARGVNGDQANNTAANSGAVYLFQRTGTNWTQEAYLKSSNSELGDRFGVQVALSEDVLAVGAFKEDSSATGVNGNQADNSIAGSGAVYVYRRSGTSWSQEAYVKASNTGNNDSFGESLALSGDTLAVGARGERSSATGINGDQGDGALFDGGAVYVFRRVGTSWSQEAYVKASNTESGDSFGLGLALFGDTLAVGAFSEDSNATGLNGDEVDNSIEGSGAVYVFQRTGTNWSQEAYLKASNTGDGDAFGVRVALSKDTLAVAAFIEASSASGIGGDEADNSNNGNGAVYVFTRVGTTWSQEAYLKQSNTPAQPGSQFGIALALSEDTLAVGAYLENSDGTGIDGEQFNSNATLSGAAYLFQ
jgi:hypothetical protein